MHSRSWLWPAATGAAVGMALGWALWVYLLLPVPQGFLHGDRFSTLLILDRNGVRLREVRSTRHGVAHWVELDRVSPQFVQALICAEDRRFYSHPGVDPLALARAAWSNLRAGKVVSGGSTITQQLVRNLYPARRRTVGQKLWEMVEAVRVELRTPKPRTLEAYVNRVPFGNQAYGIDAAAGLYFNRAPSELSLAQSAFLAVLPRQPITNDPYRDLSRARRSQRRLLGEMLARGRISAPEYEQALAESIAPVPARHLFRAPHFTDLVLRGLDERGIRSGGRLVTTLDWRLQERCEELLTTQLRLLAGNHVTNGAVLVLDRRTGAVLAMVGSADYFSSDAGQVNACLSRRQPGSALKPFAYACGFERGMWPGFIIPDIPLHFVEPGGDYAPRNYDRKFHGPVSCRTALACSYNVPAVRMVEYVGPERFLSRLRSCGMKSLERRAGYYGLALGLGAGDVTLAELANGYRVLANGGYFSPLKELVSFTDNQGRTRRMPNGVLRPSQFLWRTACCVLRSSYGEQRAASFAVPMASRPAFDPVACFLVTDILSDDQARSGSFGEFSCLALPFACAVKTGTSKDFRDNWTVGYTTEYVVGVWLGNFDNSAMLGVSGVTGAGPLFRDVMLTLHKEEPVGFEPVPGAVRVNVCPKSGRLAGRWCPNSVAEFVQEWNPIGETCTVHRMLKLDRRTGAVATGLTPPDQVVEQLEEVYPELYWPWMQSQGMSLPTAGSLEPKAPGLSDSVPVAVLFPDQDDMFKIDPNVSREFQSIVLKALVPLGSAEAVWNLDGRELGRSGPPFTWLWNLAPGRHTVAVSAAGSRSEPVCFRVIP